MPPTPKDLFGDKRARAQDQLRAKRNADASPLANPGRTPVEQMADEIWDAESDAVPNLHSPRLYRNRST